VSRDAGFDRCDLDTGIFSDPKFKKLARNHPDLIAVATAGYIGIVAQSWRAAERLSAEDAWPAILPWSPDAVVAMQEANLLDVDGKIVEHAWESWFGEANRRRLGGRARWQRYNKTRGGSEGDSETAAEKKSPAPLEENSQSVSQSVARVVVTTELPRGNDVGKGKKARPAAAQPADEVEPAFVSEERPESVGRAVVAPSDWCDYPASHKESGDHAVGRNYCHSCGGRHALRDQSITLISGGASR
jgi:hypothetical protein